MANHACPTLGLLVPVRPDLNSRVYTYEESQRWVLECIGSFPKIGRSPKQLIFHNVHAQDDPINIALGYNFYPPGIRQVDLGDEISIGGDWDRELDVVTPLGKSDTRHRPFRD